jgi:hypothetical protein
MGKRPPHFFLDPLLRPVGMKAVQERRLVPPRSPVKAVCRLPTLIECHAPKHFQLFGTRLFIRQHETRMRWKGQRRKSGPFVAADAKISRDEDIHQLFGDDDDFFDRFARGEGFYFFGACGGGFQICG